MYRTKVYTGPYAERQRKANMDNADVYLEVHANSVEAGDVDYALSVVSSKHSATSYELAAELARAFGTAFDVGHPTNVGYDDGVRVGGRGDGNLAYTAMPAVLIEPGFGSNPKQARLMESDSGIETAASIIVRTIIRFWPAGASVALSVGHKGNKPKDMGAAWAGERFQWEAEWADAVVNAVQTRFSALNAPPTPLVGVTAVKLRAHPDWSDPGFVVLEPGTPVGIVHSLKGADYRQNGFIFIQFDNVTGWASISHVVGLT